MKRIIFTIIITLISLSVLAQQDSVNVATTDIHENTSVVADNDSPIREAIEAYNEGDFRKAIELLEAEIKLNQELDKESAELYYNLGNAYFRVNELGHSRLNYERAALLDPSDRDIQHNIDYVTTRVEDKILEVDTFFLSNWFNAVQNIFGSNTWAIAGVVLFLLLVVCLFLFFFTQQILLKKTTFYIGLVLIIFAIFANIFAYRQRTKVVERDTAIIMSASVSVVSSPDINSKELFRLHVGTKVKVTKDDRNWLEIEIDNGSVGWVQRDKLEII